MIADRHTQRYRRHNTPLRLVLAVVPAVTAMEYCGKRNDIQNRAGFATYLTIILRSSYVGAKVTITYDGPLIYKTSHEGRKAFLRYDSLAKS